MVQQKKVRKKIGICVKQLDSSQLSYVLISRINNLLLERPDLDIVLFYENMGSPCMNTLFACMNISEIWNFNGLLISTNIETTELSIKCLSPERKIFYVWELEFLSNKNYLSNLETYRNKDISLVTCSNSYCSELENYCNRTAKVIEDFNLKELIDDYIR